MLCTGPPGFSVDGPLIHKVQALLSFAQSEEFGLQTEIGFCTGEGSDRIHPERKPRDHLRARCSNPGNGGGALNLRGGRKNESSAFVQKLFRRQSQAGLRGTGCGSEVARRSKAGL